MPFFRSFLFLIIMMLSASNIQADLTDEETETIMTWVKSFDCYAERSDNKHYNDTLKNYLRVIEGRLKNNEELALEPFDYGNQSNKYLCFSSTSDSELPKALEKISSLKIKDWKKASFGLLAFELANLTLENIEEQETIYDLPQTLKRLSAKNCSNLKINITQPDFSLTCLTLDNCGLKEFPVWILTQKSLISLDLCNNPITRLPQGLSQIPLREFRMWECRLITLPISLHQGPFAETIEYLYLAKNQIGFIDPSIIRSMKMLKTLGLSSNGLPQQNILQIAAHLADGATLDPRNQNPQNILFEERY